MKVVCVVPTNCLVKNKIYDDIEHMFSEHVTVVNEIGNTVTYFKYRFISLKEYRTNRLKELLKALEV